MSFITKLQQQWNQYVGPKDERIEAEMNRLYKVGFIMLALGWLMLLYYDMLLQQVAAMESVDTTGAGFISIGFSSAASFGWILLTCLVLIVMQCRRGFMDVNRFGETETFPAGYFALVSAGVGVGLSLVVMLLRVLANVQVTGGADGMIWIIGLFVGGGSGVMVFLLCLLAFYLSFCSAKRNRRRLAREFDEPDDM